MTRTFHSSALSLSSSLASSSRSSSSKLAGCIVSGNWTLPNLPNGRSWIRWWISCLIILLGICALQVSMPHLGNPNTRLTQPAWMLAWNSGRLDISHGFVTINTFSQLWYIVTKLRPMNTNSTSSILTHIVSKTFAGIGVLDFLHNGSAAFFKDQPATLPIKVLTGLGFGLASAASDWIFGVCLVYDLVALAVGQKGDWRTLLSVYAVGCAGLVTARNIAKPPYVNEYTLVGAEDNV